MAKPLELTGSIFGRLTVIGKSERRVNKKVMWHCTCLCGESTEVTTGSLRNGVSTSCGCYRAEVSKKLLTTHGKSSSHEYFIWQGMKDRCLNPNNKVFKHYGGRGIEVCNRWLESFDNFITDRGNRPNLQYSIERIDNSLGYNNVNCKWASATEQARNTRVSYKSLSGVRGITLDKPSQKWLVRIGVNGTRLRLGLFETLQSAKDARKAAERKYWGN
jgi:hypothetical protein